MKANERAPDHAVFYPRFESAEAAAAFLEADPSAASFRAVLGAAESSPGQTAGRLLEIVKQRLDLLPHTYFELTKTEQELGLPPETHREVTEGLCSLAAMQLAVSDKIRLPKPSKEMRLGPRQGLY